jgi:NAD(P)-dependent dehydrogenase (short-subunit alcohol dehydrogenase family)
VTDRPVNGLYAPDLFADASVLIVGEGRWTGILAAAYRARGARVALVGAGADSDLTLAVEAGDAAAIDAAFQAIETSLPPVATLIVGPPPRRLTPGASLTVESWRAVTGPGYDGVFLWCAGFARRRLAAGGGGTILALMDEAGGDGLAAEAATAAGVANLVRTLGAEWGRDGIRTNGLSSKAFGEDRWTETGADSLTAMSLYLTSPYSGFATCGVLSIG